jgi:uncharacterized protein (TIGR02266 family)
VVVKNRENRKHARRPLRAEIELGDGTFNSEILFESGNLSLGGLFVRSELLLEVGETFWVTFKLPGASAVIRARGRVVWVNRRPDPNLPNDASGMGIEFLELTDVERAALIEYLSVAE